MLIVIFFFFAPARKTSSRSPSLPVSLESTQTYASAFSVGAVRIFDLCGQEEASIRAYVAGMISSLHGVRCIAPAYAIGGTASTLASVRLGLCEYDAKKLGGLALPLPWLREEEKRLLALSVPEREKIPGMDVRRADVIAGAAVLLSAVMEALDLSEVRFSDADYRKAGVKVSSMSKDDVAASPGKNLVLIYMESLESSFLDERMFPGLTPRLNALANEALCFDNISPALNADYTFGGIYASMMGLPLVKEVLRGGFVNSGIRVAVGAKLPSLPSILNAAGYEQVFLRGVNLSFAGMNVFLGRERFDRMAAYETEFPGRSRTWGCSDAVLFDWAFERFQQLAAGEPGAPM